MAHVHTGVVLRASQGEEPVAVAGSSRSPNCPRRSTVRPSRSPIAATLGSIRSGLGLSARAFSFDRDNRCTVRACFIPAAPMGIRPPEVRSASSRSPCGGACPSFSCQASSQTFASCKAIASSEAGAPFGTRRFKGLSTMRLRGSRQASARLTSAPLSWAPIRRRQRRRGPLLPPGFDNSGLEPDFAVFSPRTLAVPRGPCRSLRVSIGRCCSRLPRARTPTLPPGPRAGSNRFALLGFFPELPSGVNRSTPGALVDVSPSTQEGECTHRCDCCKPVTICSS